MKVRNLSACSLLLVACAATQPLRAQLNRPGADALAEMGKKIQADMTSQNIPGVEIAVMSRGTILHLGTYGMADVENRVPVSDSTVFEIGSISKQFTSAATLMLAQEGKLRLDDPIHKYLPWIPSEWIGVTIRHLLTHTSGIPDYEEIGTYDTYRERWTPEQIIRIANQRPMDFEPGQGWYYSNTGYFLLSMIVERVDGKPLNEVLTNRIFKPLGMTQTRMASPEDIIPHRSRGYWVDRTGVNLMNRDATQTSSTLGAGGLLSTGYDMAKWDASLYGTTLLSDASKKMMWTATILPNGRDTRYGFGWDIGTFRNRRMVGHTGQVAGFVSSFTRLPDDGVAILVLTNRYRINQNRIRDIVADVFLPASPAAGK
jgi:CubicO group peptidase (beta-lactamase class C family)